MKSFKPNFLVNFCFQERGGASFTHEALSLKYSLDNEFELVFVVGSLKINRPFIV